MTPRQRQLYLKQQDAIETFYAFHPDIFAHLTREELQLLDTYYFIQRPIDVDSIADHAAHLLEGDPTIWKRAETILRKVFTALKLDEKMMHELLPGYQ